jgi:hypothetical protein
MMRYGAGTIQRLRDHFFMDRVTSKGQSRRRISYLKTGSYRLPEKSGETIPARAPDTYTPEPAIELFSTWDRNSNIPISPHMDTSIKKKNLANRHAVFGAYPRSRISLDVFVQ